MSARAERIPREFLITPDPIELRCGQTSALVLPQGGLIAAFSVGGVDVFFPAQTIRGKGRGGAPLLFPNAGPLAEGQSVLGLDLGQHGFARDTLWDIYWTNFENKAVLNLHADKQTKARFPFDFGLHLDVRVGERFLRRDLAIANNGEGTMPAAPGWHDYLFVPVGARSRIRTNIPGFDPVSYNWETPTCFPGQEKVVLEVPGRGTTVTRTSSHFKTLMVWAVPGLPILCLEPWVGPVNALLEPEQRLNILPGEAEQLWMEIQFQPEG
jgi:galactose mutarotase-like enzyme